MDDWFITTLATNLDPAGQSGATEQIACNAAVGSWESVVTSSEPAPPVDESKPPLYVADNEGDWIYNGAHYTAAEAEAWVKAEIARCRDSLYYFATRYCYTVEENLQTGTPPEIKLVPSGKSPRSGREWGYIETTLDALGDPTDNIVIEKTRDMLASWLCMITATHDLLFRMHWPMMTLSYLENKVDDGGEGSTRDCLHGKVRFICGSLPPFMRAANPVTFTYLHIRNPATKSHITGFAATPRAGRGPKWKRAFLDEFAFAEKSEQILMSVGMACPRGKVMVSTANGKANAYYRIARVVAAGVYPIREDRVSPWKRYTLHWREHPERDEAWKVWITADMTDEAIAQEIEIDYEKALSGRVYTNFEYNRHAVGAPLCEVQSLSYDERVPLYVTCDFNVDPMVWELVQPCIYKPRWRVIGEICRRNAITDDAINEFILRFGAGPYVRKLLERWPDWESAYGQNGIMVAGEGGHKLPVIICGDATEEKSNINSRVKTYYQIRNRLGEAGFKVSMRVPTHNPPRAHRFEVMNHALKHDELCFNPEAEQLIKDCESGVWNRMKNDMDQTTADDDGSGLTRSHASSALGYLLCVVYRGITTSVGAAKGKQESVTRLVGAEAKGW